MPNGDGPTSHDADRAQPVHEAATVIHAPGSDQAGASAAEGHDPAAAGVATLDKFSRALVEIGLIDAVELEAFAADSAEGVLGLSRALVKAGKLTPYQAAAVYQKKSRGLLVGNYLILDKLGQGGMGVVFLARHRRFGRVGALKILPPSFARDRDAVLRFRREVEAAGRLKHPNLVAAQDADEDRGVHFLVMDYVEGRDLDRIVRDRGPMPVAQAVDCLIQAARGLEAAHAQGIIHRDIKPGNLMLDNSGTVRVLDLGLARIVDAANPFSKSAAGRLTQSGMYMGTIDYMAPEQAEDSHRVDHRADIYSLGCTLYYLLTGKVPFLGETVLKRLIAHMEHPAPSLRSARPGISPAVEAAYQKMMAKRPDDRLASMAEVIALLEACKAQALEAPKSRAELKVFNEPVNKRASAPTTKDQPSVFGLGEQGEGPIIEHDLNLEDLVMDVRPEARPASPPLAPRLASARRQPLKRMSATPSRSRAARQPLVIVALVAVVVLGGIVGFVLLRNGDRPQPNVVRDAESDRDRGAAATKVVAASGERTNTILDGARPQSNVANAAAPDRNRGVAPATDTHGSTSSIKPPSHVKHDGAFDFPQAEATILCDRPDLRLSAWNNIKYLYVQAYLWRDDQYVRVTVDKGREHGARGTLTLDLDADGKATQNDREYAVYPWRGPPYLRYTRFVVENAFRFLLHDSKGRGAIRYVDQGDGRRVRVDSFVIPLDEIGVRPGQDIRLAYSASSLHPFETVSSLGEHQRDWKALHSLKLSDRPRTLDVTRVPEGWENPGPLPMGGNKPNADAGTSAREISVVDASTEYGKALSRRPTDARVLIERGRLLADQGRWSEADADFTHAAQLAPDKPQWFVEAGWWLAGAYPTALRARVPLESDPAPDPSKPPAVPWTAPRRWQSVETEPDGKVDLGAVFHADNIAAYALAIVYSASERDVVVFVSNDDRAKYWINGRHVLDTQWTPPDRGLSMLTTMQAGRNTILAKVINQSGFHYMFLRISEAPADLVRPYVGARKWAQAVENYEKVLKDDSNKSIAAIHDDAGRAYAELGRWQEAATAFRRARRLDPKNYATGTQLLMCYLALNDAASYQPLCKELIEKCGNDPNPLTRNNVIWTAALLPAALPRYAEVVQIAAKLLDVRGGRATYLRTNGSLLYRDKQYRSAVNFLNRSNRATGGTGDAIDWVFLAMAWRRLGEPGANDALKQAVTLAKDPKLNWQSRAAIRALLEEARREFGLPALP